MRGLAIALGVLALIGGSFAAATAQPVAIQLGKAIGPIEIGMPLDRARTVMEGFGTVEEVDTPTARGFCNPDSGVGVCAFDRWQVLGLNTPGTVAYVITDDARFATESGGHKVGQPLLEFLRTFGLYNGGQGAILRWDGRGLAVEVGPAESGIAVRIIGVFTPRAVSAMAPAAR
ncbi:MAG: hypothetical protein QN178_09715 [Armatimonadota bacterium]|nr:hypothetical protein [Armatimonadota bacterium]